MAKDPNDRYITAGDLAQAALRALSTPDQHRATDLIQHSQHFAPPPRVGQFWGQPAPAPSPGWAPSQPVAPWPPPKRRLGLIFGALVVVVAAVAGTGILFAVRKSGTAQSDRPVTSTTAAPAPSTTIVTGSTAAPTVVPAQLDSLLVPVEQINTIVATTGIVVDHSKSEMVNLDPGDTLSDDKCLAALIGFQAPTYDSSGYTGVLAQLLKKPQSNPAYVVAQGAVVFASAAQAQGFVSAQAPQWRDCAGRTVTQVSNKTTFEWTFGQLSGNPPNIALQHTLANSPLVCQHVLSAVSNVVFDVNVCAPGTINQARQIANMMAARLPR
ncbi:hypothetical protein NJB14197_34820 [Mycobacterium montefiorense]|uniref:PknH-like extracellular domain-containing protein n=1 Tax=Mycobacterium montefiorense TaxID=154654 RepID=A0AA37PJB3_9MYCO|nr:hypothetical protein MmonteBS_29830 [Mycobacterium montefiorense]GKU34439.1 hypothetical protein NJB14191_17850 [Mycobacterium montefiorense]GKU39060.1 hypothetical protein NJB14192_10560 [Mycobacterium montefiorense]GKU47902.1 hypothetical protein NJB14194_45190 [Mycobacterium montefiorense]GKU49825.1 hypothetical protein NJB14195_10710 [Mycobacterium montefiorense]